MGKGPGLVKTKNKLVDIHIRLFAADVAHFKKLSAQTGVPYQIEIRTFIRRGLRGERREITILKE